MGFLDWFRDKPNIRGILLGVAVGLATYAGAAKVFGTPGRGYNASSLNDEQIAIVERWENEHQERKTIVKEMQALNAAKAEVEEAIKSFDKGNHRKCLDHIINANGILQKIKRIDTRTVAADLFEVRKRLSEELQKS